MNVEETSGSSSMVADWNKKFQYLLDKTSPHLTYRWIAFLLFFILYVVRVYLVDGWYIVTYGLGIYLLNQFIGFLTPQFDPENGDDDLGLPTRDTEEFRPFARRLPEFKFWYSCIKAILIATFMTFFSVFDVPVFWPILVLYFFILFYVTMKRQISHMIKHKYVPWNFGKATYNNAGKLSKDGK